MDPRALATAKELIRVAAREGANHARVFELSAELDFFTTSDERRRVLEQAHEEIANDAKKKHAGVK